MYVVFFPCLFGHLMYVKHTGINIIWCIIWKTDKSETVEFDICPLSFVQLLDVCHAYLKNVIRLKFQ